MSWSLLMSLLYVNLWSWSGPAIITSIRNIWIGIFQLKPLLSLCTRVVLAMQFQMNWCIFVMNLARVVSKAHQLAHIPRVAYYKFHLEKKKEEQHVQMDVVLLSQKQRYLGSCRKCSAPWCSLQFKLIALTKLNRVTIYAIGTLNLFSLHES